MSYIVTSPRSYRNRQVVQEPEACTVPLRWIFPCHLSLLSYTELADQNTPQMQGYVSPCNSRTSGLALVHIKSVEVSMDGLCSSCGIACCLGECGTLSQHKVSILLFTFETLLGQRTRTIGSSLSTPERTLAPQEGPRKEDDTLRKAILSNSATNSSLYRELESPRKLQG